jgi:ATP-dependent Clp protease ATP-binding subunit ClpA
VNKKHFRNVLLITIISFFSLIVVAGDLEFKFPNTKRKIIYSFGKKADSVVLIDETGAKHTLKNGAISGLSVSTSDFQIHDQIRPIIVGSSRNIEMRSMYKCDLPLAIIDGQVFVFDGNGATIPVPQISTKDWDSEFATAEVRRDGASLKVIAKTEAIQGYTKTQLIYISTPELRTSSVTFRSSLNEPFNLQDYSIGADTNSNTAAFVLFNPKTKTFLRDADGNKVKPALLSDMTVLSKDIAYTPKLSDPVTAITRNNSRSEAEPGKLLALPNQTEAQAQAELQRIHSWLADNIIGQPEVVERFYKMALKRYMYGQNLGKPEQITLMGAPGTGKDTAVHAYVDAINNEEGAWKNNNHMFEMPVVKTEHDLWSIQGSATGHVGSENITPFISFIVKHQGGKYKEVAKRDASGKTSTHVELNPAWKEGEVLEGYFPPSKGVIFVNESQHWSKQAKDQFLKKGLDGTITINNPGPGESVISTQVTWVFATNEGENLVVPRKANGQSATTKPLTIQQAYRNWEASHADETRLDEELRKTNGLASGGKSEEAEGNSEAFISRQTNKILFRPLFPESLRIIAQKKLEILKKKWAESYELTWNDDLLAGLQEFMYNAEKNGRPVEDKVEKMVEVPLLDAVNDGHLVKGSKQKLTLGFEKNPDNTLSLTAQGDGISLSIPIQYSEKDKLADLKTDEELQRTIDLPSRLKKHVFGAEKVADALGKDVLVADEAAKANLTPENATESAHNVMFLGPSSVGKTEMAKALGLEHLGSRDDVKTFDFGQVTNKEHMKEKILGSRDSYNNPVPSDYMMEYDTHGGHIINVLDEAANAPADALKAIYDVLREPVVTTFSDGRARVMSHVWNIFTGNAGEEWYSGIPADLPFNMQMTAMQEIYKEAMNNPGFRRQTLEKYFSSAFIARIGESNIYFFSPMTFKSIREISQLKISQQFADILTAKNRRNWDVNFASMGDYTKTLEMIEAEGFVVKEQGASLDRFVKQTFGTDLRAFLLTNKVPDKAQVTLVKATDTDKDKNGPGFVNYKVLVNGKDNNLNFQIAKRVKEHSLGQNEEDQILTAYHEAGHELVRRVLFGDRYKSLRISIIPGVTEIAGHMIVYEGIASYDQEKKFSYTKEAILRELAVLMGGTAAQQLASRNFIDDAGKSSDTQRATDLAQRAILKWGLSEIWGTEAVPVDMSINQFVGTFSDSKRQKYEQAVHDLLKQSREMADAALLTNMNVLKPLGAELAKRGQMVDTDLEAFYAKNSVDGNGFAGLLKSADVMKAEKDKWIDDTAVEGRPLNASLSKHMMRPDSVANIDKIIADQKAAEIAKVVLPEKLPIANNNTPPPSSGGAGGNASVDCGVKLGLLKMPHRRK